MQAFLDVYVNNEKFTHSGNRIVEIPDILETTVTNISRPSENLCSTSTNKEVNFDQSNLE